MRRAWAVVLAVAAAVARAVRSLRTSRRAPRSRIVLAIHGGAGSVSKETLKARGREYRQALARALRAGYAILQAGGSSSDAVERAVVSLENCDLFNAGRGAVLAADGGVYLEATFASGNDAEFGAVINARRIRNPIKAARAIKERCSPHSCLSGAGADAFARSCGLQLVEQEYFITERRSAQLRRSREQKVVTLDHSASAGSEQGTVGAVARDAHGRLAAATSTGGMTNKMQGRVGDSGIYGAGTIADDRTAAVSCTGRGESFMRHIVAAQLHYRMLHLGETAAAAASHVVNRELPNRTGGLIAIGRTGGAVLVTNTIMMFRGCIGEDGRPRVAIMADEPLSLVKSFNVN